MYVLTYSGNKLPHSGMRHLVDHCHTLTILTLPMSNCALIRM